LNHLVTKTIETNRLVLRRFTMEDAQAMYRNWAGDAEVTKYLMWPAHENAEVSRAVLEDWTGRYTKQDYYQWAITLRENGGEAIGSIGSVRQDDAVKMVHIGYCIGRKWWHLGITSEALRALIDYFFDEVGVNRIEARHDPRNPNSGMVMRKCGMRYEGTMRQADWNNQGICDSAWYAILAGDRAEQAL